MAGPKLTRCEEIQMTTTAGPLTVSGYIFDALCKCGAVRRLYVDNRDSAGWRVSDLATGLSISESIGIPIIGTPTRKQAVDAALVFCKGKDIAYFERAEKRPAKYPSSYAQVAS